MAARTAGYEMIAVTGNCATGTMDQRFISQMKKNSVTMNGTYFSPSRLPIVS